MKQKGDSILSHKIQLELDEKSIWSLPATQYRHERTQSTVVACHRTPKKIQHTKYDHGGCLPHVKLTYKNDDSGCLPHVENNTSKKTKSSGKKGTRNVKRESSRTRGLASEHKNRRVSVVC